MHFPTLVVSMQYDHFNFYVQLSPSIYAHHLPLFAFWMACSLLRIYFREIFWSKIFFLLGNHFPKFKRKKKFLKYSRKWVWNIYRLRYIFEVKSGDMFFRPHNENYFFLAIFLNGNNSFFIVFSFACFDDKTYLS